MKVQQPAYFAALSSRRNVALKTFQANIPRFGTEENPLEPKQPTTTASKQADEHPLLKILAIALNSGDPQLQQLGSNMVLDSYQHGQNTAIGLPSPHQYLMDVGDRDGLEVLKAANNLVRQAPADATQTEAEGLMNEAFAKYHQETEERLAAKSIEPPPVGPPTTDPQTKLTEKIDKILHVHSHEAEETELQNPGSVLDILDEAIETLDERLDALTEAEHQELDAAYDEYDREEEELSRHEAIARLEKNCYLESFFGGHSGEEPGVIHIKSPPLTSIDKSPIDKTTAPLKIPTLWQIRKLKPGQSLMLRIPSSPEHLPRIHPKAAMDTQDPAIQDVLGMPQESDFLANYDIHWGARKKIRDILQNFFDGHNQSLGGVKIKVTRTDNPNLPYLITLSGQAEYPFPFIIYAGGTGNYTSETSSGTNAEGSKVVPLMLLRDNTIGHLTYASRNWELTYTMENNDFQQQEMFYTLNQVPDKPGNTLTMSSSKPEFVQTLFESIQLFNYPDHPHFLAENKTYENKAGGFTLLPPHEYGELYITGQQYEVAPETTTPNDAAIQDNFQPRLSGIRLWSKIRPHGLNRDRSAMTLIQIKKNILPRIIARMSEREVIDTLFLLHPYWPNVIHAKEPIERITQTHAVAKETSEQATSTAHPVHHYLLEQFTLMLLETAIRKHLKTNFPPNYIAVSEQSAKASEINTLKAQGLIPCFSAFGNIGMAKSYQGKEASDPDFLFHAKVIGEGLNKTTLQTEENYALERIRNRKIDMLEKAAELILTGSEKRSQSTFCYLEDVKLPLPHIFLFKMIGDYNKRKAIPPILVKRDENMAFMHAAVLDKTPFLECLKLYLNAQAPTDKYVGMQSEAYYAPEQWSRVMTELLTNADSLGELKDTGALWERLNKESQYLQNKILAARKKLSVTQQARRMESQAEREARISEARKKSDVE